MIIADARLIKISRERKRKFSVIHRMNNLSIWISLFSLVIAVIALGWHIYKESMKPKLKLSLSLTPQYLKIDATNAGPGKITIKNLAIVKTRWAFFKNLFKKDAYEYIRLTSTASLSQSLREHRLSGPLSSMFVLPKPLDIGELDILEIDLKKHDFLKRKEFISIGIFDSYGRIHWVSKKDYKRIKKEFEKEFKKP
ncbi:MAG: hypothetical protein RBR88_01525 [Candidatus Saccharicenans sp.]|nr:hypothetical protein [Candidatus Saccharicenans sp.]